MVNEILDEVVPMLFVAYVSYKLTKRGLVSKGNVDLYRGKDTWSSRLVYNNFQKDFGYETEEAFQMYLAESRAANQRISLEKENYKAIE